MSCLENTTSSHENTRSSHKAWRTFTRILFTVTVHHEDLPRVITHLHFGCLAQKMKKKISIKVEQVLEKRKAQLTPKNTLLYNFFSSLAVFQFLWHFVMPTSKITFLSSRPNFVPFQGRALFFYCWKRNLLISRSIVKGSHLYL